MWPKNGLKMSKLLAGIAGTKVEAKKVKNCEKKALSYEAPTYHNSKDRPRPFLLSFVRIKDAGEDLLSHILKLTPLVYHLPPSSPYPSRLSPPFPPRFSPLPLVPTPRVGVKEALSAKSSSLRQNNFGTQFKLAFFIAAGINGEKLFYVRRYRRLT